MKEILSKRIKQLRECGQKMALNTMIRYEGKNIKGLSPKKQICYEAQCMALDLIPSLSPEAKKSWANSLYYGLKLIYEDEVDHLMSVAKFAYETYEMKFLHEDIKDGNFHNKNALLLITKNMKGSIDPNYIK